jgi:hypothetical protein
VRRTAGLGLVTSLLLVVVACTPAAAGDRTLAVTHGPVTATLVDAAPAGPSPGDQRYFSVATGGDGGAGRLEVILSTTGVDVSQAGTEIRIGQLIFTFGINGDGVTVLGASLYPSAGSTIAEGTTTIRPIVGGAGAYSGATGWCESIHNADGTWRHVLHLAGSPA